MIRNVLISLPLAAVASTMAACGDERAAPSGDELLAGAWTPEETAPILEVTRQIALTAEPGVLTAAEEAAAAELIAAGVRLHTLYLEQVHPEGRAAEAALAAHPKREDLATLFVVMKGPIATTLTNTREPFLGVAPETPARGVYPPGTTREALDAFLAAHPERRAALLHPRCVVWAATPDNRARALATLAEHPVLDTLHPKLRAEIETAETYLAVPYSVAWAEDILFVYDRLNAAANHVADEDPAFARFLRLRARDLLADDYDGGDAAWVSSRFAGHLNAQIGSYETYDDPLYGVKTFFALSLLQRDVARSDELAAGIGDIQAVEDALPYEANKRVRADIPVGATTSSPTSVNRAEPTPRPFCRTRRTSLASYGRTILIRGNIITHPELFAVTKAAYDAAIADDQQDDLTAEGEFLRTLWHEVGHYLGVDQTADGRELDSALQDSADLLEEMKADLVSLFASHMLAERGTSRRQHVSRRSRRAEFAACCRTTGRAATSRTIRCSSSSGTGSSSTACSRSRTAKFGSTMRAIRRRPKVCSAKSSSSSATATAPWRRSSSAAGRTGTSRATARRPGASARRRPYATRRSAIRPSGRPAKEAARATPRGATTRNRAAPRRRSR